MLWRNTSAFDRNLPQNTDILTLLSHTFNYWHTFTTILTFSKQVVSWAYCNLLLDSSNKDHPHICAKKEALRPILQVTANTQILPISVRWIYFCSNFLSLKKLKTNFRAIRLYFWIFFFTLFLIFRELTHEIKNLKFFILSSNLGQSTKSFIITNYLHFLKKFYGVI